MSRLNDYIRETPAALGRLLASPPAIAPIRAALPAAGLTKIWVAGSGTSLFAAEIVARIWEEALGVDTEAIGALSFLEQAERLPIDERSLVIAISQTGATNVLVEALDIAHRRGALIIAVTANPVSPLAMAADFVLESLTGEESTPGKTKGFATTTVVAGLVGLALADADEGKAEAAWRLPLAALIEKVERALIATDAQIGQWVERLVKAQALWTVGSGRMATAAVEGGLKILEVAKLPVIGKELEEMMHGQFHAIGETAGVVFLAGKIGKSSRLSDLHRVVRTVGVPMVAIADEASAQACPDEPWDLVLDTEGTGPFQALVGAVPLQLLAERLAQARGLNPDAPRYPELYRISGSKSIYAPQPGK